MLKKIQISYLVALFFSTSLWGMQNLTDWHMHLGTAATANTLGGIAIGSASGALPGAATNSTADSPFCLTENDFDPSVKMQEEDPITKYSTIFEKCPPLIQEMCRKGQEKGGINQNSLLFILDTMYTNKDEIRLDNTVNFFCSHSSYGLSPQTIKKITRVCTDIAHGKDMVFDKELQAYNANLEFNNKKQLLHNIPLVLQLLCTQKLEANSSDHHANELVNHLYYIKKTPIPDLIKRMTYHAKKICKDVRLSPDTTTNLINACEEFANRRSTYYCADLTLDWNRERKNKERLIKQMPTIMRDFCQDERNQDLAYNFMWKLHNNKGKQLTWLDDLKCVYDINELACILDLSPDSTARLHRDFRSISRGEDISEYPLDDTTERQNRWKLISQFSDTLRTAYIECPNKKTKRYLLNQAYVLSNPDEFNYFHNILFCIPVYIYDWNNSKEAKRCIKDTISSLPNIKDQDLKQLTAEFIVTFDVQLTGKVKKLLQKRFDHHWQRIQPGTPNISMLEIVKLQNRLNYNFHDLHQYIVQDPSHAIEFYDKKKIDQRLTKNM